MAQSRGPLEVLAVVMASILTHAALSDRIKHRNESSKAQRDCEDKFD